jgi:pyruvate,water dikinase
MSDVAAGQLDRSTFLSRFGHRGAREMELAQPRWSEEPERAFSFNATGGPAHTAGNVEKADVKQTWERLAAEAGLNSILAKALLGHAERLRTYLGLRETAKHYLLRGYAEIRRCLVELDRRHSLDGGIFFLVPEELPRLIAGKDMSSVIGERQRYRAIALRLEIPLVIFSDDLEAIGRPLPLESHQVLFKGTPLSAGSAEGPALVLSEPLESPPPESNYILVCPSTDPAWVPLFVRAGGLVMESGGILSHGAIVAREFGLPAVAGLPGITAQIRTGQRIRVDGGQGTVAMV